MKFTIFLLGFLLTNMSWALEPAQILSIQRENKQKTSLLYNYWPGEYPYPVIDIKTKTTVKVSTTPAQPTNIKDCTIDPNIYHPWNTKNTSADYFAITGIKTIRANKTSSIFAFDSKGFNEAYEKQGESINYEDFEHDIELQRGDSIDLIHGESEGWCNGNYKGQWMDFDCAHAHSQADDFTYTSSEDLDDYDEQWIKLSCKEGYKGFISEQELMKSPAAQGGSLFDFPQLMEEAGL